MDRFLLNGDLGRCMLTQDSIFRPQGGKINSQINCMAQIHIFESGRRKRTHFAAGVIDEPTALDD